ncbi:hypothetical protein A6F68_00137 [Tsuneonella dongtanensis]|uniref:GIY-YIG domain-containing protein n=1 Tax=Tsuneonella dongtanensis TaxID=692370 RepID=A0A1B2A919_9SPHN|nr:hypothetical protein [Tsuneonella dongtanensis]ANY18673.1 hypothetical protein A6F68_00137 [Tsuneonella dongtanensis]
MFRDEVIEQLGFYVYRLVDPRSGETFYVGKGRGNRVFHHAAGEKSPEGSILSPKLALIAQIKTAGHEVDHHIHRHGMDEPTAYEVEAALIDVYPSLLNSVAGHRSDLFGAARTTDLVARYQAEPASWEHNCLLVGVRNTVDDRGTYEAARFAWKLNRKHLPKLDLVVAVRGGLILDAFRPNEWLPGTLENFPNAPHAMPDRLGFVGERAAPELRNMYVGKRLPRWCKLSQAGIRYVGPAFPPKQQEVSDEIDAYL